MALPAKLGVALVVALASNVSLFSMLLFPKDTTTTTSTTMTTIQGQKTSEGDAGVLNNQSESAEASSLQTTHPATHGNSLEGYDRQREDLDSGAGEKVSDRGNDSLWSDQVNPIPELPNSSNPRFQMKDADAEPDERSATSEEESADPDTASESQEIDSQRNLIRFEKRMDSRPDQKYVSGRGDRGEVRPTRRRGDIQIETAYAKPVVTQVESNPRLSDVIATLTDNELQQIDSATAEVLIPALRRLEALVLRELGTLHEISVHQERRLQRLEQSKLQRSEVKDAIKVIRKEKRKLQGNELPAHSATPSGMQDSDKRVTTGGPLEQLENDEDISGSGEDMTRITETAETMTTMTATTTTTTTTTTLAPAPNTTKKTDEMIIEHIYEIYNSLNSMEHKVLEVDVRLSGVSSEVYRERATYVRLEDKVGDIARHQKNLLLRSTMHGFKISDLVQFKGQAEVILGSAEGKVETLDAQLEVFTDRLMEQQDEVDIMRDVFPRLEQLSNEFRSADAFKTHDLLELQRSYQQVDNRLNNLNHTLDQSVGNIRWDVMTYLHQLCVSNNLQCR